MSDKIFFLPVNTGYFIKNIPTSTCVEFYRKRSYEELYCSIIGNISTIQGYCTNPGTGVISTNSQWDRLSDAIRANGTKPGIQLSRTWPNYVGQTEFKNPDWECYRTDLVVKLKNIDLSELLDDFVNSISLSVSKGFEHLQIHAAHGYLLSCLLDPYLYHCPEKVVDILKQISNSFKDIVELSIRVSAYCGFPENIEACRREILKAIYSNGYEYIDISEGYYNYDKGIIYPNNAQRKDERLRRSLNIAQENPTQKFIISGWSDPLQIPPPNVYKGFCRQLIADPEFAKKLIYSCKECGECHYYSLGRTSLSCGRWNEREENL